MSRCVASDEYGSGIPNAGKDILRQYAVLTISVTVLNTLSVSCGSRTIIIGAREFGRMMTGRVAHVCVPSARRRAYPMRNGLVKREFLAAVVKKSLIRGITASVMRFTSVSPGVCASDVVWPNHAATIGRSVSGIFTLIGVAGLAYLE